MINPTLKKAINYFGDLILSDLLENDIYCWVLGGCVKDFFIDGNISKSKDIDLYFSSNAYLNKAKKYFLEKKFKVVHENNNSISFTNNNITYDLVKIIYNDMRDCIDNTDFTCVCCAISHDEILYHDSFFIDVLNRNLIINSMSNVPSTLSRVLKYVSRGFFISHDEYYKLLEKYVDYCNNNKSVKIKEKNPDQVVPPHQETAGNQDTPSIDTSSDQNGAGVTITYPYTSICPYTTTISSNSFSSTDVIDNHVDGNITSPSAEFILLDNSGSYDERQLNNNIRIKRSSENRMTESHSGDYRQF